MEGISSKLRQIRLQAGISPEELGKRAQLSGNYIRRIESGERSNPTLETLEKIARGLGVSPDVFMVKESKTAYKISRSVGALETTFVLNHSKPVPLDILLALNPPIDK